MKWLIAIEHVDFQSKAYIVVEAEDAFSAIDKGFAGLKLYNKNLVKSITVDVADNNSPLSVGRYSTG